LLVTERCLGFHLRLDLFAPRRKTGRLLVEFRNQAINTVLARDSLLLHEGFDRREIDPALLDVGLKSPGFCSK
jgi:hypothetical protein